MSPGSPSAAARGSRWRLLWIYLWTGPTTAFGLVVLLAALATGGRVRRVGGVLECWGGAARALLARWPFRASAMALGHVILGAGPRSLERSRAHELVHVRQAERWGPFFLPVYLGASLWAALRGRHPYRDNPFEIEARRPSGR